MKMKALALGIVMAGSIGFVTTPAPVQASGIPVIDVANLQQTIAQYMNMIQQLKNLESQLSQAKQQYEALTGGRGMGTLSRTAQSYIPTDWRGTLAQMQGGRVGEIANEIQRAASMLDNPYYVSIDGTVKESLDGSMRDASNAQARNAHVFDQTRERRSRLNALADAVNSTADLKAAADLQARIAAEQTLLLNELISLQSMNAMVDNQRQVENQRRQQISTGMFRFDSSPKGGSR